MEFGDLKMTKPNFSEMPRAELRKYILDHRTDEEAFQAYMHRLDTDPDIKWIRGDTPEGLKLFESKLKKGLPETEQQ